MRVVRITNVCRRWSWIERAAVQCVASVVTKAARLQVGTVIEATLLPSETSGDATVTAAGMPVQAASSRDATDRSRAAVSVTAGADASAGCAIGVRIGSASGTASGAVSTADTTRWSGNALATQTGLATAMAVARAAIARAAIASRAGRTARSTAVAANIVVQAAGAADKQGRQGPEHK